MKNGQNLHILHLASHLDPGGITSYIRLLGQAMAERGHVSEVVSGGGSQSIELEKLGIQTHVFPIRTKNEINPKLFLQAKKISEWVKKNHFSILHAHSRVTQVLGSAVSALSGVPLVTTAHGFFKPRFSRRLFPAWGSRVIAISLSVAEDLQKNHRISIEKIRVVSNAIDQATLDKRLMRMSPEEAKRVLLFNGYSPLILSIGRLVADKGHSFLIDAVFNLKKDFPEIFLVIVGDGRERQRLEKKIKDRRLSANCAILSGQVDLAVLYKACDIFVHPATHREGFGLTLAEAMYAQKPIIATRIPALDRLYSDGENALLVPPSSEQALSRAIRYCLERPKDAERIAQNGARWARNICSPHRFASEIEAVYREVIG